MRKIALFGSAAALFAVPAVANAQAYVQVEAGVDVAQVEGESEAGINYGVSAGYDYQIPGGMFVGLQGSYNDSDAKRCISDVFEADDKACVEGGRDVSAVVRVGTAIGERSKLYVLGGYTNARVDVTYDGPTVGEYEDALGVNLGAGGHADLDGLRLGAGYELALSDKYFAKVEYRYSNYEQDFSRHQGVVALGVKF